MKLIREHDDFNFEDDLDWIREVPDHTSIFWTGGRVRINPRSKYRNQARGNWGTIESIVEDSDGKLWVWVKFDNGYRNSYRASDLLDQYNNTVIESSEDFDWIREVPLDVSFEQAEIGKIYRIEPTEVLKNALESCGEMDWLYYSNKAEVITKSEEEYNDIYCDHESNDVVLALRLRFYYGDREKNFWVSPDMVKLYEMGEVIQETENPLQWIIDEPVGITLQPNTLYYFKPNLTLDEIKLFANGINNSEYIKNFLLRTVLERVYQKGPNGGLKYFVTGEDVNDRTNGWCTETSVEQAISFYPMFNQVDARKEFGI